MVQVAGRDCPGAAAVKTTTIRILQGRPGRSETATSVSAAVLVALYGVPAVAADPAAARALSER